MSIASEITRLQGVKSDILQSISDKGVTVPVGSALDDCPGLIGDISVGSEPEFASIDRLINTLNIVDKNGNIGFRKNLSSVATYVPVSTNTCILSPNSDYSASPIGTIILQKSGTANLGGKDYRTININGKTWLAENLDYEFSGLVVGASGSSDSEPRANYYNNDKTVYGQYGLLYNWAAVNYLEQNKATLIPGWRVPTSNDINDLIANVGGSTYAGKYLKDVSCNGLDWFSFSELMAGMYYSENSTDYFQLNGDYGIIWTSSERTASTAYYKYFGRNTDSVDESYYYSYDGAKSTQYSVRLVKDS